MAGACSSGESSADDACGEATHSAAVMRAAACDRAAEKPAAAGTAHLYVFTAAKGGMENCDKALQQRVIEELSSGSAHLRHAQKMDEKNVARARAMATRVAEHSAAELARCDNIAERLAAEVENERESGRRWCAVVDMDMFYAAIVIKDNPHLADKPVAVGGMSMLSTSNYVARRYGVRAAMPGFIAKELCARQGAELIFMKIESGRRHEEAAACHGVMAKYGPIVVMSDDEAKIDLTERVQGSFRAARQAAAAEGVLCAISEEDCAGAVLQALRDEIYTTTSLTASGCVATNYMLAKIGADKNKPNGQFVAPRTREGILEWLTPLAIRKVPGVGKVTERLLREGLGMTTVGDVLRGAGRLVAAWGVTGKSTKYILRSCLGVSRDVLRDYSSMPDSAVTRLTVGAEKTFRKMSQRDEIVAVLRKLCNKVEAGLARDRLEGRCVAIKLKLSDFRTFTRQVNLPTLVHTTEQIYAHAVQLLDKEMRVAEGAFELRLLGVRVGGFKQHLSREEASDTSQMRLSSFFRKKQAPGSRNARCADSEEDDVFARDASPGRTPEASADIFAQRDGSLGSSSSSIVCLGTNNPRDARARCGVVLSVSSQDSSDVCMLGGTQACGLGSVDAPVSDDSDVCVLDGPKATPSHEANEPSPRMRKRLLPTTELRAGAKRRRETAPKITSFLRRSSDDGVQGGTKKKRAPRECILLD